MPYHCALSYEMEPASVMKSVVVVSAMDNDLIQLMKNLIVKMESINMVAAFTEIGNPLAR